MGEMIAVIQAGGMGSRMRDLTHDEIPKPLLQLNGKPILLWQIETIAAYGIKEIVIMIGHLGDKIRSYFGNGESFGVHIRYIEETEPLGSAGALYYLNEFPAERYLLVFGDVVFDIDISRLLKFHLEKNASITAVCHPNTHPEDSDLVMMDKQDRICGFLWKNTERNTWYNNLVNAGISLFERSVLKNLGSPQKTDWEKDVVNRLITDNRVYGYRTSEYIKDTGTPKRFYQAEEDQRKGIWRKKNLENKQRCVFLDRDGTVNILAGLVYHPKQLELYPYASEAIRLLNESDFLAVMVTNQPVVARGLCTENDVIEIHKKLETVLGESGAYLDDIIFCPHHPDKGYPEENPAYKIRCECRKPKTGMIDKMAEKYNIDLSKSYLVGDSSVDIETGKNAGIHTILVETGEAGKDGKYKVEPNMRASDLLEAIKMILGKESQ